MVFRLSFGNQVVVLMYGYGVQVVVLMFGYGVQVEFWKSGCGDDAGLFSLDGCTCIHAFIVTSSLRCTVSAFSISPVSL